MVKYLIMRGADINKAEDGQRYVDQVPAEPFRTNSVDRKASDLARVRALIVGSSDVCRLIADEFHVAEDFSLDAGLTPILVALLGVYDPEDKERPELRTLLDFVRLMDNNPAGTDWKQRKLDYRNRSPLFREIIADYKASMGSQGSGGKTRLCLIDRPDTKSGWSPFLWATYTGRLDAMELLIDRAADPFATTPMNRNALHVAAESRSSSVLERVLQIPEYHGKWFELNGQDRWKETPLHIAASRSAVCVKLLLERGADKGARQENAQIPLHYASLVEEGPEKLEIVDLLTADGESYVNAQDEDDRTPIFSLLEERKCIELLLEKGADPYIRDSEGKSVLHYACSDDCAASLELLLQRGADPNLLDRKRKTLIHYACDEDSAAAVEILLRHGANPDFVAPEGEMLFHYACIENNANALRVLLRHPSAAILATKFDRHGATPISGAFHHRSAACAELLITASAIADFNGKNGLFLVHHAAKWGHVGVLEAVLGHPSFERGLKTDRGLSAADVAKEAGMWVGRIADLLLEYDSKGKTGVSLGVGKLEEVEAGVVVKEVKEEVVAEGMEEWKEEEEGVVEAVKVEDVGEVKEEMKEGAGTEVEEPVLKEVNDGVVEEGMEQERKEEVKEEEGVVVEEVDGGVAEEVKDGEVVNVKEVSVVEEQMIPRVCAC